MGPWGRFVENISSKLAFFPPRPSTYEVREHNDGTGELYIQPLVRDSAKVLCQVKWCLTRPTKKGGGGQRIITAFVPYRGAQLTILYSHGNAVDLGQMLPVYKELGRLLRVNVMGYDYSGYGVCTGEPSVSNTLSDISAVYECLKTEHKVPAQNIVLYGQSVGSGPTAWLAAQEPDVGGVVLHSPILSGVRVLNPGLKWWPAFADVYPNHLLVPKIKSPVLIMHGTEDEVIHITCGQRLHDLCFNKHPPLWAEGYNHQNIEMSPEYLPTMLQFLKRVSQLRQQSASGAPPGAAAAAAAGSGSGSVRQSGGGSVPVRQRSSGPSLPPAATAVPPTAGSPPGSASARGGSAARSPRHSGSVPAAADGGVARSPRQSGTVSSAAAAAAPRASSGGMAVAVAPGGGSQRVSASSIPAAAPAAEGAASASGGRQSAGPLGQGVINRA